jgi:hypothetical protein
MRARRRRSNRLSCHVHAALGNGRMRPGGNGAHFGGLRCSSSGNKRISNAYVARAVSASRPSPGRGSKTTGTDQRYRPPTEPERIPRTRPTSGHTFDGSRPTSRERGAEGIGRIPASRSRTRPPDLPSASRPVRVTLSSGESAAVPAALLRPQSYAESSRLDRRRTPDWPPSRPDAREPA